MKKLLLVAFVSIVMVGCQLSSEKSTDIRIKTSINQTEQVAGNLTIMVKSYNDSRCPEGCECIWAGEVKVFFTLGDNVQSIDTSLILPLRPYMQFKNYGITLKEVNPHPICNYPNQENYSFYFQIDELNK